MTDEKLNQILEMALALEISEADIKVHGRARKNNYKKILKFGFAVAACVTLVITVAITTGHFMDRIKNEKFAASNNPFIITVKAAELTENSPVYFGNSLSNTFGFAGWENGKIGFAMEMPLSCKGDNIERITYSIEGGAFSILECDNDSIIINSEEYKGDVSEVGFAGKEIQEGAELGNKYISSYTVAYEKQNGENTFINICGNHELPKNDYKCMIESHNPQKTAQIYNKIFQDVTITCTVNFKDGTIQTKRIGIGSDVMSYEEFGEKSDEPMEDFSDDSWEAAFLKMQLK